MTKVTICCSYINLLNERPDTLSFKTEIRVQPLYNTNMFKIHRNGPCLSEPCYKETILQKNNRKMTILYVKFHGLNKNWEP